MNRHPHTSRRRGSAYVLVLTTSMIVTVIGVTALTAVRLRSRAIELRHDKDAAQFYARSAVDMGLFWIGNDPDWRTNRTNGDWETNRPIGNGTYTLNVTDPTDSDLTNAWSDPIVIQATGSQGRSRAIYQVTLKPDPSGSRPIRAATLALSPLTFWPLQDAVGSTATDLVSANNGSYINSVTLNSYDPQLADVTARFDGANDYVSISNRAAFQLSNGSISIWFKPNSVSGKQGLFSKDSFSLLFNTHYLWIYLDGSRVRSTIADGSSTTLSSASGLITAGNWHHLVYEFGSGGMKLYINGQLAASNNDHTDLSSNTGTIALGVLTSNMVLSLINGWSSPFGGRIAHVGVFNYQLSSDQITNLYNAGNPTRTMRIEPGSWKQIVQ